MDTTTTIRAPEGRRADVTRLMPGLLMGLTAASIGALYTVYARWGIERGLSAPDLTVLRFGVAGLLTLPVLIGVVLRDRQRLTSKWLIWLAVAGLAGTPFGLLMFGALQFAPASHAAVFPFATMSVAGMVLAGIVLGETFTWLRGGGVALVIVALVLISGVDARGFTLRAMLGDLMFIAAGIFWAGFGILLRRHRLDPLLATAVISFTALMTYVPGYLLVTGGRGLLSVTQDVLWTEILVQGVIAGAGTLFAYAKMVSMLGGARAAVFPALAPGIAALMAWPVLHLAPTPIETIGLALAIAGLLVAVSARPGSRS